MIRPKHNHRDFSGPMELAATLPVSPFSARITDIIQDLGMDRHTIRKSAIALVHFGVAVEHGSERMALDRDTAETAIRLGRAYEDKLYGAD